MKRLSTFKHSKNLCGKDISQTTITMIQGNNMKIRCYQKRGEGEILSGSEGSHDISRTRRHGIGHSRIGQVLTAQKEEGYRGGE